MHSTPTTHRRLALLPVEGQAREDRPAIRRYKLGRVLDDLGAYVADSPRAAAAVQAPAAGVRAP